jgi:serine/threonine protein kinase/Tol biopolymer transport system component
MVGQLLSHYAILRQLGKGGMGEVYLAEDLHLKRPVALKVLPEALRQDHARLTRFRTEAEAAAQLNHPNIATIYSIEEAVPVVEADGRAPHGAVSQPPADDRRHDVGAKNFSPLPPSASTQFITMEYVDGQPLNAHIPKQGLSLDQFFAWFIPLADALAHAHEHGVTHRDLKPGNIMVSKDGLPKILDFGLARITRPEPAEVDSQAPTKSVPSSLTQLGTVMGTPAYMSPEQAEGKPVDHRSDIFSFGVVLYEALTGTRPFQGESYISLISSILKDEPASVTTLRPELSRELGKLLRNCLQKDRRRRVQTMLDVRREMEEVQASLEAGTMLIEASALVRPVEQPAVPRWRQPIPMVTAAAVLSLFIGILATWTLKPSPEPPLRKFQLPVEGSLTSGLAISPDGTKVVYTQNGRLWIRELNKVAPRELPETTDARNPFWSPHSNVVGYVTGRTLKTVAAEGGPGTTLCELPGGISGATWNAEGTIIIGQWERGLYAVSAQGGEPRVLMKPDSTKGEASFGGPGVLLDGRTLVFSIRKKDGSWDIVAQSGNTRTPLITHRNDFIGIVAYSPSGHLVYQRGFPSNGIWAVPFDLSKLAVTGESFLVDQQGAWPSVSADGLLVYRTETRAALYQLVWVNRSGRVEGIIGQPQEVIHGPSLSPDGSRVAVGGIENGNEDIWIHDVARGTKTRLTFDPVDDYEPTWSPAGDQVAFTSVRSDRSGIFLQAADGSGTPQRLVSWANIGSNGNPDWSRDGHALVYHVSGPNTGRDLWYVPLTGERKPVLFLQTPFHEGLPVLSPDSRYIAYVSNESGRFEVYVKPFPQGEGKWQVSVNGGVYPRWNRRGTELFYVEGNTLMAAPVETQSRFRVGSPQTLFTGEQVGTSLLYDGSAFYPSYDVTADGQRFVIVQPVGRSITTPIMVVENWAAEFKK